MSKTILITGASSGIGRASAIKFQQEGWNVVATMRSPERETELNKLNNVLVSRLDVLDHDSIHSAMKQSIDRFGRIDVVLNNAGYGTVGIFESIPRENAHRQFGVNVLGLFEVTKAVLPHFRENKSGMFINISSTLGKTTLPLASLYSATKFAVEGFSESLHYELAAIGVKVKIVEPGAVATDFSTRSLDYHQNDALTEYVDFASNAMAAMMAGVTPETMSSPERIADVIYHAATDETNTLRYPAGADAEQMLTARKNMTDEEFIGMMKHNLKLA